MKVGTKIKVCLNTITKVKEFCQATMMLPADIEIRSDRYIVDGKSIMGIFSLDLSKDLDMVILPVKDSNETTLDDETYNKCIEALKPFIVEEVSANGIDLNK